MRPGEVYLAQFPFGDVPGMKLRPVLLLTEAVGSVPEVLVAYISSAIPAQLLPSDVLLDPTKEESSTHLKTTSVLRLHKLATIHCASLARHLGAIEAPTQTTVATKLKDLLKKMGISAHELLRTKESIYRELSLAQKQLSDDEIIDLMVKYPDLIQRPIVEKGAKAILARPAERINEIL